MTVYARIGDQVVTHLRLLVPATGPWTCDFELDGDATVEGQVTLTVGSTSLVGTATSASFSGSTKGRIVAGGGGWSTTVEAKGYHSDAGVKTLVVASDAAREVGESLGTFEPSDERMGIDYVRSIGPASRALEEAIGSSSWWVDFEGLTQVGTRATTSTAKEAYEVASYDPRSKRVTLSIAGDDFSIIGVGSTLEKGLPSPLVVRDLEVELSEGELVLRAWLGDSIGTSGRLAGLFNALVERAVDRKLFGAYRYRCIRTVVDRYELQVVSKASGLPDLLPIDPWPGIPGASFELTPGVEVLVSFEEGDRTKPYVTAFAGKRGEGHVPVSLTLSEGTRGVARLGDLVEIPMAGVFVTITPLAPILLEDEKPAVAVPAGSPCYLSFSATPPTAVTASSAYGVVASASGKVRSG